MYIETNQTGLRFLKKYLSKNPFHYKRLDVENFRHWISRELEWKEKDLTFQQLCKIRDIKKKNLVQLKELERNRQKAEEAYNSSPHKVHIEEILKNLYNTRKAILGLSDAILSAHAEKQKTCGLKLEKFRQKEFSLNEELENLLQKTPEKKDLEQAIEKHELFLKKIGLVEEEEKLKDMYKKQAHRSQQSGSSFETDVQDIIESHIIPFIISHYKVNQKQKRSQIRVLSQVKLGCAKAEFDHVIIRIPKENAKNKCVEVLAIIEVKRNPNDLVIGFENRQENIAWFTGEKELYDAQEYRTKIYSKGHFDQPAYHCHQGEEWRFEKKSFRRFKIDPELQKFMNRLFFITQPRHLKGIRGDEYSKIMHRIASDVYFDLDNIQYLKNLLKWTQEVVSKNQTIDVLKLYALKRKWGKEIIFKA